MSTNHFANHSQINLYATCAGFKKKGKDLAVIHFPENSITSAVFTQNQFVASPVKAAQKHLQQSVSTRALLINSGNANCGNGQEGDEVCEASCQLLAEKIACRSEQILPFSTGVINQAIELSPFIKGIQPVLEYTDSPPYDNNQALQNVAEAIMTTDTQVKLITHTFDIAGHAIEICGIAKGSGMIHPNMATMLAFVWTNATIAQEALQQALIQGVNQSFNCISVDGDTSTNDACTLTATATSSIELSPHATHPEDQENWLLWQKHLNEVLLHLAQSIVRDGEGATKLVAINVCGGKSEADCKQVAFTIAHSPLVKTALYAEDPNLGRIAAAVGRAGVVVDFSALKIYLDDYLVMENGQLSGHYQEEQAEKIMQQKEFNITVNLFQGNHSCTIWSTDLSHQYVSINADYRS